VIANDTSDKFLSGCYTEFVELLGLPAAV
jgi:hypothetical protein